MGTMTADFTGEVAVVTGGGGVLCGAMASALGRLGAKVAVLDLFPEAAQAVVDDPAFPVRVPRHFVALMRHGDPDDAPPHRSPGASRRMPTPRTVWR